METVHPKAVAIPRETQEGRPTTPFTIHSFFEAQVLQAPDATAVAFEGTRLSYAELNQRANQLAHYLRSQYSVSSGDLVGLLVNRSHQMIIGMLGILKAGAAYVPIDPKHPPAVIADMLNETGVKALLLDSDYYFDIGDTSAQLFLMDDELDELSTPNTNPDPVNVPHDLAYVIYTSGSTGKRKGVAVEHQAALNTLRWRVRYYQFNGTDATLQFPSYAFDSSVVDIFSMLMAGGALVIPREELRTDPLYLKRLIQENGVTHFVITPTFYNILLDHLGQSAATMRTVTVAGEATTTKLVQKHFRLLPHAELINEYGPTENAVCSTACRLHESDQWISIGTPIDNVRVYILDGEQNPVAAGEKGEIYLAGAGVARGYLNQPELTAERFVPDPFVPKTGDQKTGDQKTERMYKTGDIGCWREDGQIQFFGRRDNQVKIRGFRIELGEIEHALSAFASVQDAVVLCREDATQEKQLAAFVVCRGELDERALRMHLRENVPHYMVPDSIVPLEQLPLTLNGKVDRKKLLTLATSRDSADGAGGHMATGLPQPRNETEAKLFQIWTTELGHARLSATDDFFVVGGDSLRAVKVVTKIHEEFDVELAVPELYIFPTIEKLAQKIQSSH